MSKADYLKSSLEQPPDCANPLLEGIVLASNELELLPLIARNPFLNKKWLAENQDIDLFRTYLSHVIAPSSQVFKIGLDVHKALKISAYQLNPAVHKNHISYFSNAYLTGSIAANHTTHCGVVILGLTGLGKTHLLIAALSTIPQTIRRKDIPGMDEVTQITWIRIDMTSIASIDALAEQIIQAIDDALGAKGKVFEDTLAGVRSASAKMERALRLMRTHYVSILAVDEIQANNFSKPGSSAIRDWFLRIANQKIALVFSGNPLGFELQPQKSESDEGKLATQQLRRLFATNRTRLDPAESVDDPDWQRFIRTLATCHLDGSRDTYNNELEQLKLLLTGGFQDFYVGLHCELEKLRNMSPTRIVDEEMIKQAANESSLIQVMQPLITAFASRDCIALRRCVDVDHNFYMQKWRPSVSAENCAHSENPDPARSSHSAHNPSEPDPLKAIAADRKKIENTGATKRAKANQPASSIKTEVLKSHLDQVRTLIAGSSPADAAE